MREKAKDTKSEPFDVNLVVRSDGTVLPKEVDVEKVKRVTFHPEGSRQVITVKFVDRVPFKDWECSIKTAELGKTLSGKMRKHTADEYKGKVFTHQIPEKKKEE